MDDTAGAWYETASLNDPFNDPNVTPTSNVRDTPADPRHTTMRSDDHPVASHVVLPARAPALNPCMPIPEPATVMESTPMAMFENTIDDEKGPSYEMISVNDPDCNPAVIPTRIVPPTPDTVLHPTELADTHTVASHAVPSTLTPPL